LTGKAGSSACRRLQRRQERIQDSFNIAVDFIIMKTSDTVATIAQDLFSRGVATALIVGRVCRAVEFHDKLFLSANKVGEIGSDGLLPNELEPAEKAVSKSPPKLALSLRLVPAQFAGSARFVQA
jgi:hypothetical protein